MQHEALSMTFEDALTELEAIVRRLEEGKVPLEEAITAYERGSLLRKHCEEKLTQAKMRVEKIALQDGEVVKSEPLDEA